MKIGIYAPYLRTCGGGEKYICSIAEVLSEENEVEFIVPEEPNIRELRNRLNVRLDGIKIKRVKTSSLSRIPYLRLLSHVYQVSSITRKYDLFINQEHFSLIPSLAKRNILICEVPFNELNVRRRNPLVNLLFDPKARTYDKIVVNSYYTKKWIKNYYKGKRIEVLYPPVDTKHFRPLSKQNIILNVGRFFVGFHCKKQLEIIRIFKRMYANNGELKDWELHFVGGVTANAKDQMYLKRCQEEARGYPIHFHINASFRVLKELYGRSKIYLHAAGLNEDTYNHPERAEHFGIAVVEAMSAGCVPVVINKGGLPEIVRNGIDGFLWNTPEELEKTIINLVNDQVLWEKMSKSSIERSKEFDIEKFRKKVMQVFMY